LIIVFVRTIILYTVVLIAIRIMGKSELSKMSPFQMVILFMIAELAAIPIDSTTASLINGVIAIFTLLFLQVSISYLSIKSEFFKTFISGKPSILIEEGKINVKEMSRLRISINDLAEQLRLEDCPSIADVEYAVLESNGELTVIPKSSKRPLTPEDIGLTQKEELMPLVLVSDGFLYKKNLERVSLTTEDLNAEMKKASVKNMKEIFVAFADSKRNIHIFTTPEKGQNFSEDKTEVE
jgi:uncharacterized membrane protein YcaP (DUF421 family)